MARVMRAGRKATYEDLLAVPDHLIAEIIDGELVTSPRPASPHTLASSAVGSDLFGRFHRGVGTESPGGWWILDEPELHLGDDVLVPDLAGWRRERMPTVPTAAFFELAPDWVCEIVSPSSARYDRVIKQDIYARRGDGRGIPTRRGPVGASRRARRRGARPHSALRRRRARDAALVDRGAGGRRASPLSQPSLPRD